MIDLYMDPVIRDIVVEDFDLRVTETNVEWVSQTIESRLRTFMGEWFLNRDLGIPYFDSVFVKAPDMDQINGLFLTEINDVNGIEEILSFNTVFDTSVRKLTVTFTVQVQSETITGTVLL